MVAIVVGPSLERQASEVTPYWEGHWEVKRQDVISYQGGWLSGGYSASSLMIEAPWADHVSQHYTQELQKRAHNKGVKPQSYASGKKIWLNSKYIKTKRNQKSKAKFFGPFRVLYPVEKQTYKLELPKKWKIHDVFHILLLKQDTTKKGREFSVPEFEPGDNKEYKVKTIRDSTVYAKEADRYLPGLYYLIV